MSAFQYIRTNGPPCAWLFAGLGAGIASAYQNKKGLDKALEECQEHVDGAPNKVDNETLLLVERLKEQLGWNQYNSLRNDFVRVIPSSSLDFSHQGSLASQWGGAIILPAWFQVKEQIQDGESGEEFLRKHGIQLDSTTAHQLLHTFSLSEEAKRFVLAKELEEVKSYHFFITASFIGSSFPFIYALSSTISQFLPFPGVKLLSYCLIIPLTTILCCKGVDYFQCSNQRHADKKAADMSEGSAKGGVEFYDSLILRQRLMEETGLGTVKADRSNDAFAFLLTGESGGSLAFLNSGYDFLESFRKPYLSPTERRQILMEEYANQL